jgi:hypothetical protein
MSTPSPGFNSTLVLLKAYPTLAAGASNTGLFQFHSGSIKRLIHTLWPIYALSLVSIPLLFY